MSENIEPNAQPTAPTNDEPATVINPNFEEPATVVNPNFNAEEPATVVNSNFNAEEPATVINSRQDEPLHFTDTTTAANIPLQVVPLDAMTPPQVAELAESLDLSQRFIRYDPNELKGDFLTTLNEVSSRLQTGDGAKLLGNELMKKFRLTENRIRARLQGDFRLVVMGDFKRGKSTLVNALLEMSVATTNVTPETVTINEIEYGETLAAQACLTDGGRVPLGINELMADTLLPLVESMEQRDQPVDHLEIKAPIEWLRGVQLVDTPGMGDVLNRFDRQVQEYLQKADAIIFLVSALSPLSETEENFLRLSLKPADFSKLIFVVNMLDFARNEDEVQKVLNLISNKVGRLFPNSQVFGLSALDEICRLQNTQRPNPPFADMFAQNFQNFRSTIQESILLDRDMIQLDRACGLLKTATVDIERATNLLRGAMQQDQSKLAQAVTDLGDDNSELAQKVVAHKKQMRDEIAKLGEEATRWMSDFLDRIERETIGSLASFHVEDVQKHFQFFLTEAIRNALNGCIEAHNDDIMESAKKARLAIASDSDNVLQINLENRTVAAATASGSAWSGFDTAASVFMMIPGLSEIASIIKIGGKLFFKKTQGKGEMEHFQKHLQSSLPELRQNLIEEVRETYANVATRLEQEIETAYQQERSESLAALERAQVVKSSGAAEFANADTIFAEISDLLAETRTDVGKLANKIFPPALDENAPPASAAV